LRTGPIVTRAQADQAVAMHDTSALLISLTFVLAGLVKGVIGMGLPTVAVGLLGLMMTPAQAAALLIIPSLITNVWQFATGPHRLPLLRRTWPMLLAIFLATWASAGLLAQDSSGHATTALGLALVVYALFGLAKVRASVSRRLEPWLSPIFGATTGLVTGATGVFVLPAVPYLQALDLDKEDLIQALGLSFTVSTLALAAGLASHGAFRLPAIVASILYSAPAILGMFCGQRIRLRVAPATFRLIFLVGLVVLGTDLSVRSLL
jgi:uncharacterized protein